MTGRLQLSSECVIVVADDVEAVWETGVISENR